jgi:hypothetical protein
MNGVMFPRQILCFKKHQMNYICEAGAGVVPAYFIRILKQGLRL